MTRNLKSVWPPLRRACSSWVGSSAKMSVSIPAGALAILSILENIQPNWSRSARMSSWPIRAQPCRTSWMRPTPYRSCSQRSQTRSVRAMSKAWPHPGGNITGLTNFEYAIAGKWLELLKEIAPRISRVAVMRESAVVAGPGQFAAIQAAAAPLGIDLRPIDPRDPGEIEHAIAAFAHEPNGGLIVTGSSAASNHRKLIFALAARHRLPVVYNARFYVSDGGLISYGPDFVDQYRRAASYVDRILKGEKPADLPVQAPTKYELVINLKTAKALGLTVPDTLLARADEVIE